MEANELRIGNTIDVDGNTINLGWITGNSFSWRLSPEHWNPTISYKDSRVKPIPLTEDWLIKFGFERTSFGMKLNGFNLEAGSRIVKKDELCGFSYEQVPDEKYIGIKYVHQLQNLYYALTQTELKHK